MVSEEGIISSLTSSPITSPLSKQGTRIALKRKSVEMTLPGIVEAKSIEEEVDTGREKLKEKKDDTQKKTDYTLLSVSVDDMKTKTENSLLADQSIETQKPKVFKSVEDAKKAVEQYQTDLTHKKTISGEGHPEIAKVLSKLGVAFKASGNLKEALNCHLQALAIRIKNFGEDHLETANSLSNVGLVLIALGELKQASEYLVRDLVIREKIAKDPDPNIATKNANLGTLFQKIGELNNVIKYFKRALAIYKPLYGENHRSVAICLNNLGTAHQTLGDKEEALKCYQGALAIKEIIYGGKDHLSIANTYYNLAQNCLDLEEIGQAKSHIKRALEIRERLCGSGSKEAAEARELLEHIIRHELAKTSHVLVDVDSSPSNPLFTPTHNREKEAGKKKSTEVKEDSDSTSKCSLTCCLGISRQNKKDKKRG